MSSSSNMEHTEAAAPPAVFPPPPQFVLEAKEQAQQAQQAQLLQAQQAQLLQAQQAQQQARQARRIDYDKAGADAAAFLAATIPSEAPLLAEEIKALERKLSSTQNSLYQACLKLRIGHTRQDIMQLAPKAKTPQELKTVQALTQLLDTIDHYKIELRRVKLEEKKAAPMYHGIARNEVRLDDDYLPEATAKDPQKRKKALKRKKKKQKRDKCAKVINEALKSQTLNSEETKHQIARLAKEVIAVASDTDGSIAVTTGDETSDADGKPQRKRPNAGILKKTTFEISE